MGGPHRRKSRNFTAPTGGPPTIAFVDTHPLRSARAEEVFLLSCLISDVHGDWLMMSGAIGTEQVDAACELVAGIAPSLFREIEALQAGRSEEDLCYKGLVPTIHWAATRWICALELPRTSWEVWEGPRLGTRLRPEAACHPSVARAG